MATKTENETKIFPWLREKRDDRDYPISGNLAITNTLSRTSSSVPNWKSKIARCQSATSGLYVVSDRVNQLRFYQHVYYRTSWWSTSAVDFTAHGFTLNPVNHIYVADPGFDRAFQGAKSGWVRKLDQLRTGVNALVTAAEARESYAMIKDRGGKIRSMMGDYMDATIALRKKHNVRLRSKPPPKKLRAYLEEQNQLYLEFNFGWAPFLGEISDWEEEIRESAFRGYRNGTTLLSSFTDTIQQSDLVQINNGYMIGFLPIHWHRTTTLSKTGKFYGFHLLETLIEDRRLDGVGLRPGQFVCSLWELFPWSWAVDYFSNVGLVLMSLTSKSARLAWSQTTQLTKTVTTIQNPEYIPSLNGGKSAYQYVKDLYGELYASSYRQTVSGFGERSTLTLTRTAGTPSDMTPDIEIKDPSAWQSANLLSALAGKFKVFKRLL